MQLNAPPRQMAQSISTSDLAAIFYRGDHAEVLGLTYDCQSYKASNAEATFLTGALAFVGRLDEAFVLHEKFVGQLDLTAAMASRFYLAIAYCRHSRYQEARRLLRENALLLNRQTSALQRFFIYQGLGFYRFFCGRFQVALRHAKAALSAAIQADFTYGKFLAIDLCGHSMVQSGAIAAGLEHLQRALTTAFALGNGGMAEATQIGIACYQAQFGLLGNKAIAHLEELRGRLKPQNTYSEATLLLELARQASRFGDVAASQNYLDEAGRLTYGLGHRRYNAIYNHRQAYNLYLAGNFTQALHLLRLAKNEIHAAVDLYLDIQLSGLQWDICRKLGLTSGSAELESHLATLTQRCSGDLAKRLWQRRSETKSSPLGRGQDVIGDLLDHATSPWHQAQQLLQAGYVTLFRTQFDLHGKQRRLLFEASLGGVVLIEPPSVTFLPIPVHRQLWKLLLALASKPQSKEDLVISVWGYDYSPLRHDQILYQALARLRKLLGSYSHWLDCDGATYRLHPSVNVIYQMGFAEAKIVRSPVSKAEMADQTADLEARAAQIMLYLRQRSYIKVKHCVDLFDISRATAARDLATLCEQKLLRKFGKGRATRYELIKSKR